MPETPETPAGFSMSLSQLVWFQALESYVERTHRTGFSQSLIIHVAALLAMAVVVVIPKVTQPPPVVVIAFNTEPEASLLQEESPLEEVEMSSFSLEPNPDILNEPAMVETASAIEEMVFDPLDVAAIEPPEPLDIPDMAALMTEMPVAGIKPLPARGRFQAASQAAFHQRVGGMSGGDAIGGELGQRLNAAGAMTGDVQVSIGWDGTNDIDVHVMVEPLRRGPSSSINWTSRMGICGGILDVDANAHPQFLANRPVENIFWRKGAAPYGRYTVAVHHFRNWSNARQTTVEVAVLVDGKVERYTPVVTYGDGLKVVTTFVRPLPTQPPVAPVAPGAMSSAADFPSLP